MISEKESQRQAIEFLWNKGIWNAKDINKRTDVSLSTIYDCIKRLKETGTAKCSHINRLPRKITNKASHALEKYIRQDSSLSTRTLAAKLSKISVEVSYRTIGRHLGSLGYQKSLPTTTPMLTAVQKENRVKWARKYLNDCWKKTLFTDETAFQLFRNTVERWHKEGERPIRCVPKDRTKIFAWGGFCNDGKTSLYCFSQIMNAEFYVNILRQHVHEAKEMMGDRWRFQQDNDPKHTSRLAKKFLAENVPTVIDWPSCSPDLNPLENLWSIVKGNVERRMPNNLDDLRRFMMEEWEKIPTSTLNNLVGSMKGRCQLIINYGGERIPY
jgi:transposase